jgi:hypothetical protein
MASNDGGVMGWFSRLMGRGTPAPRTPQPAAPRSTLPPGLPPAAQVRAATPLPALPRDPTHELARPEDDDVRALLDAFVGEAMEFGRGVDAEAALATEAAHHVLEAPVDVQAAVLLRAMARCGERGFVRGTSRKEREILAALMTRLMRSRLPLGEEDLIFLLRGVASTSGEEALRMPIAGAIRASERYLKAAPLSAELAQELSALRAWAERIDATDVRRLLGRIDRILGDTGTRPPLDDSGWGKGTLAWLMAVEEPWRQPWIRLLRFAATGATNTRPNRKWLEALDALVAPLGTDWLEERVGAWMSEIDPSGQTESGTLTEGNADVVKGMIWCVSRFGGPNTAEQLGAFAERCWHQSPSKDEVAHASLGNATLFALGNLPGGLGRAELERLSVSLNDVGARVLAGSALDELKAGEVLTADASTTGADLPPPEVPSPVPEPQFAQPEAQPAMAAEADDRLRRRAEIADRIRANTAASRDPVAVAGRRIERAFANQRSWSLAEWLRRYVAHAERGPIARRLIWGIEEGDRSVAAVWRGTALIDVSGEPVRGFSDDARVHLWHPLESEEDEVLAWRARLAAEGVVQPFRQVHREIYRCESGEVDARFAGRVVRQHAFAAVCRRREWAYNVRGTAGPGPVPSKRLETWDLVAELAVDPIDDPVHPGESTDGLPFLRIGSLRVVRPPTSPIPLHAVPEIGMSEILRDVDILTQRTDISGEPGFGSSDAPASWTDDWRRRALGDLTPLGESRRLVLSELIRKRQALANAELGPRFLTVRGAAGTYDLHLGSGLVTRSDGRVVDVALPTEVPPAGAPYEDDPGLDELVARAMAIIGGATPRPLD